MTFFNDLWKRLKSPVSPDTELMEKPQEKTEQSPSTAALTNLQTVLQAFEQNEIDSLQKETVLKNLSILKSLVDQPKEDKPELRFSKIKQHLGDPECHETVRQERWPDHIRCPQCQATKLKRLAQLPNKNPLNHRYQCLVCQFIFSDDSDTPIEKSLPPINIWMQCWYLMGCTESLSYIATKLGLDLGMVEYMVNQLQKIFNAQKPLTRFVDQKEWNKQAYQLKEQLKEDLLKQYERLNANVATAPKDTTEFRRQQNLRRDLTSTTAPPSSGKKR